MKRFANRLSGWLSGPLGRLQRRFQQARPGSILIMVVALLVLLALMGTAFMSSSRLERYSAGTSKIQQLLDDTAESYAKATLAQIETTIASDSPNLITATTDTGTTPITPWLMSRAPHLLPDLVKFGPTSQFKMTPAWASVSQLEANQQFESPWNSATNNPNNLPLFFQGRNNAFPTTYFEPTNIVINYNSNGGLTDSSLVGQTRTFPGFFVYTRGGGTYTRTGPFLVGDASGMGVADSAMIRLTTSPIQGIDFYASVRVIDNADAFNVNTAWSNHLDVDIVGNSLNFFPSQLDLLGALNTSSGNTVLNNAEMHAINALRWNYNTQTDPTKLPIKDDNGAGVVHSDMTFSIPTDALWMQLSRRALNPNKNALFGDFTTGYGRPYGNGDTASTSWHGGLLNLDNTLSKLDNLLSNPKVAASYAAGNLAALNSTDSIYGGAANCVANSTNRFRFFAANNVGYWYDWYYNLEGVVSNNTNLTFPIGSNASFKTTAGRTFRSIRPFVVGYNPTANLCLNVDHGALPDSVTKNTAKVPSAALVPAPHPYKTSLNTAEFPELWCAFINGMGGVGIPDPKTHLVPLKVPGEDVNTPTPNSNGTICRNVLRDPNAGTSKSTGFVSPIDKAPTRFVDSTNVLMLRAALAAVNVQTLREGHGYAPSAGYFIPDPVRQTIALTTTRGPVQVLVYGATANPYIGEVYANTDQTDHGGKSNAMGFVAVKLYNPYPFQIDMSDYQVALLDRNSGGTYPNMKVTLLDKAGFTGKTIASNSVVVLTNYNSGSPSTKYLPTRAGTMPAPASTILVNDLHKVFNDPATPGSGGELVLLRKLTHAVGSIAEVPVDCYDFTGLALNPAPLRGGPPQKVIHWHYVRPTGGITIAATAANRWKCVYPGAYDASKGNGGAGTATGRFVETDSPAPYDPTAAEPALARAAELNKGEIVAPALNYNKLTSNNFLGIQICNAEMGGYNKFDSAAGAPLRAFPFGGFARVGDLIQAPFVGSYVVLSSYIPVVTPSSTAGRQVPLTTAFSQVVEMNPVTVDTCFADDGDSNDDGLEQVGRFCPIYNGTPSTPGTWDDYDPTGGYRTPSSGLPWRYHFATNVLEQFTTVSNPELAYLPNMSPVAWNAKKPIAPYLVPSPASGSSEGRINLNSASWRMLAAINLIPSVLPTAINGNTTYPGTAALYPPNGITYNEALAQLIVRYRDVDDGTGKPHGPFRSILELNKVFDPSTPTRTFQNGLGLLNNADPTYLRWGNYVPGPSHRAPAPAPNTDNLPANDYVPKTIMATRISNMVTLRSDSFTAYVLVQGWRNVGTRYPELVLQKRVAVLIDRSSIGNTANGTVSTYNIPAD